MILPAGWATHKPAGGAAIGGAMIIYAVTVSVDPSIEEAFSAYMRETHVPDVLATGCFVGQLTCRVIEPAHPAGWPTYAFHYRAASKADLDRYIAEFAPALRKDVADRFGDHFSASRAVLEELPADSQLSRSSG
jgi:hypothetical protein